MSPAHKRSVITWAAGLGFALLFSFYILGWYLLGLLAVVSAWVYYSSLEGVGPRPGLRDLLDRTVAFLLGTRWAEVLHNRLNGGGGHWKGRGRSVRGRPQAGPRNPGRAPGNSYKWELVNCEQRNPLAEAYADERSPADLMMGSYLSNENSAQASFGNREIRNRYSRPNPMQTPTRRLSFGEHQAMMNKFTVTPRRRYPIHQPQYSVPGTLPTVRWDGYQKKNVLSSRNSPMVQSPVTVKIARPDANMMRSSLLDYMMSPAVSPLTDPCSKATVLSALKESRKRAVEDDAERTLISERENKRRRHDSSGSGHSAFEPLLANGAPASLIPKPGTLKRSTNSQCSDDPISKRSRTSSISSLSSTCVGGKHSSPRNPIFSSYSSTRGHVQGAKNYVCVRNASPLSSPASSRSQTPERPGKKKREEVVQRSDTSTPVKVDRTEKDQTVEEESVCLLSKSSPSTVDCSPSEGDGKRKRKIPLLSKRKGDQLTLHPPLELGYTITADDVDSEKKAGLDRIKKALQEKEEPAKSPTPVTTTTVPSLSVTFTAPTGEISAEPTASSTPISAVVSSPLLVSLKKMQNCSNAVSNSDSVDGVTSSNTVKALESSAIAFKNDVLPPPTTLTTSMAMTTDIAGFKPIDVLNFSCSSITQPLITPINKPATKAITTTTNSCQVSALVSPQENKVSKEPEMSTVACTGSSAPPSTSFSLPSTVTAKPAVTSVTAPSSASTAGFKPVFGLPVAQQTNIVSTASSLTMPVTTPVTLASITSSCATSTISFKPVFGNSSTPATSTTTSTPFTFGQSTQAAINNETAVTTTCPKSISSLFPFTASNSLAGSNVDSETKGSKATFSFGLSVAVTSKPNTTTTAINNVSSPQLFQFGSNPSTTTAAPSDVFQFGKGSADTSATSASPRASVFGQSTVVTSQVSTSIAPTSNLFGGFGPSVSTPATTSSGQLALAFGNSAKTSLFGNATSAPPFGGPTAQLNFGGTGSQSTFGTNAAATQKVPSKTPAFGNAVTPFSFGASAVKSAFPSTTSQSTFGTPSQSVFGSATAQTGFGSVSTQPFGSTSAAFSFGTTTTSTAAPMFNATKSLSGGTTGSIFGSSQMVGFGSSNQAAVTTSGFTLAASNPNIAAAGFFGSGQSGFCSSNPSVPFATSTSTASSQNMFGSALTNQAQQNQSTPQFNFGATNTVENKPVFGGTAASGFGQSTPSGNFSFGPTGAPATTFGSPGAGAAAPSAFAGTPTFSIGAGSRPTGTRQRLQARRQHVRKR